MIDSAVVLAINSSAHKSQLIASRPKSMLPALGKPLVVRVMERLYRAGIRRYLVVVGVNEGGVASYLNKQWKPDATIELLMRNNETIPLMVAKAAEKFDNAFLVASYNSFSYERFFTAFIKENENFPEHLILAGAQLDLSPDSESYYAIMDGQAVADIVTEKPGKDVQQLILGDMAICGTHFTNYLKSLDAKQSRFYGRTLLELAKHYATADEAKIMADETSWMLRIQNDRDLLTLNKRLLEDSNDSHILSELPYTVKINSPVRIDPQVSVGQGAVIGPYVYIESGCSVGYGATIQNALILEGSSVPTDADINGCIMTRHGVVDI